MSSRQFSDTEKKILCKGLELRIKSIKVDTYEIMDLFEELAESLNLLPNAK